MPAKVIVFGSSGQLGRELVSEFTKRGDTVVALDRAEIDIADADSVERCFTQQQPAIVVNAAAYNMVDVAEKEPLHAFQVNALAVRHLAVQCRRWDARLVHYSTDYVFDGAARRPYTEDDKTHPLGAYAVSKLAGELYALAYLDEALVIRTSGVFGGGGRHTARGNFPELMLRLAAKRKKIRVVADHIASPTYAPALAARTVDLITRGEHGVFHIGGGRAISWFDYAKLIFQVAGLEPDLQSTNEREYRTDARRPKYSALTNTRVEALGLEPMPKLEDALREYLDVREAELAGSGS
ncbi:MAG: dTDP-4-dehydrorhamnose reductase [bacterium]|nr:dTDP-4-dehydrorhamnose reductase [bacterium]